ncbi:unnamed protein product [Enterobius vermicularis]|uniref:Uncharacterized protein n=1 Tax=Enterobius vermicularis TaxID=51028 RepID=A0A0N4UXC4_ENTVE|nr:unnamed protein product [Enterobius vermicularis]
MIGQIVYIAVMVVAFGLTVAAVFSPGWADFKNSGGDVVNDLKDQKIPKGIFSFFCKMPGDSKNKSSTGNAEDQCKQWFDNLPGWEKAVVATMILALLSEIAAIAWTVLTCCACCCKQFLIYPLPLFAGLAAIFLAVAVGCYGSHNKNLFNDVFNKIESGTNPTDFSSDTELGYSFYLACVALGLTAADIIVGLLTVTLAKKCL